MPTLPNVETEVLSPEWQGSSVCSLLGLGVPDSLLCGFKDVLFYWGCSLVTKKVIRCSWVQGFVAGLSFSMCCREQIPTAVTMKTDPLLPWLWSIGTMKQSQSSCREEQTSSGRGDRKWDTMEEEFWRHVAASRYLELCCSRISYMHALCNFTHLRHHPHPLWP